MRYKKKPFSILVIRFKSSLNECLAPQQWIFWLFHCCIKLPRKVVLSYPQMFSKSISVSYLVLHAVFCEAVSENRNPKCFFMLFSFKILNHLLEKHHQPFRWPRHTQNKVFTVLQPLWVSVLLTLSNSSSNTVETETKLNFECSRMKFRIKVDGKTTTEESNTVFWPDEAICREDCWNKQKETASHSCKDPGHLGLCRNVMLINQSCYKD